MDQYATHEPRLHTRRVLWISADPDPPASDPERDRVNETEAENHLKRIFEGTSWELVSRSRRQCSDTDLQQRLTDDYQYVFVYGHMGDAGIALCEDKTVKEKLMNPIVFAEKWKLAQEIRDANNRPRIEMIVLCGCDSKKELGRALVGIIPTVIATPREILDWQPVKEFLPTFFRELDKPNPVSVGSAIRLAQQEVEQNPSRWHPQADKRAKAVFEQVSVVSDLGTSSTSLVATSSSGSNATAASNLSGVPVNDSGSFLPTVYKLPSIPTPYIKRVEHQDSLNALLVRFQGLSNMNVASKSTTIHSLSGSIGQGKMSLLAWFVNEQNVADYFHHRLWISAENESAILTNLSDLMQYTGNLNVQDTFWTRLQRCSRQGRRVLLVFHRAPDPQLLRKFLPPDVNSVFVLATTTAGDPIWNPAPIEVGRLKPEEIIDLLNFMKFPNNQQPQIPLDKFKLKDLSESQWNRFNLCHDCVSLVVCAGDHLRENPEQKLKDYLHYIEQHLGGQDRTTYLSKASSILIHHYQDRLKSLKSQDAFLFRMFEHLAYFRSQDLPVSIALGLYNKLRGNSVSEGGFIRLLNSHKPMFIASISSSSFAFTVPTVLAIRETHIAQDESIEHVLGAMKLLSKVVCYDWNNGVKTAEITGLYASHAEHVLRWLQKRLHPKPERSAVDSVFCQATLLGWRICLRLANYHHYYFRVRRMDLYTLCKWLSDLQSQFADRLSSDDKTIMLQGVEECLTKLDDYPLDFYDPAFHYIAIHSHWAYAACMQRDTLQCGELLSKAIKQLKKLKGKKSLSEVQVRCMHCYDAFLKRVRALYYRDCCTPPNYDEALKLLEKTIELHDQAFSGRTSPHFHQAHARNLYEIAVTYQKMAVNTSNSVGSSSQPPVSSADFYAKSITNLKAAIQSMCISKRLPESIAPNVDEATLSEAHAEYQRLQLDTISESPDPESALSPRSRSEIEKSQTEIGDSLQRTSLLRGSSSSMFLDRMGAGSPVNSATTENFDYFRYQPLTPVYARTLDCLVDVHYLAKEYNAAIDQAKIAIKIKQHLLKQECLNHEWIVQSRLKLAKSHFSNENWPEALKLLGELLNHNLIVEPADRKDAQQMYDECEEQSKNVSQSPLLLQNQVDSNCRE